MQWPSLDLGHVFVVELPAVSPFLIAALVFVCAFGGALLGLFLHEVLPKDHLGDETREVVKLGMGLVATMTALVLGLVTATAKSAFDEQDSNIKHSAAKLLTLDRTLAQYGPETAQLRTRLKEFLGYRLQLVWPEEAHSTSPVQLDAPDLTPHVEGLADQIRMLAPKTDAQRALQSHATDIANDLHEQRWMILGSMHSSVPTPFLTVVVFWLAMIFASFGLFAPRNATVVAVLFVCALSVAASTFLILELDDPFHGIMKVSSAPMRYAVAHLAQ